MAVKNNSTTGEAKALNMVDIVLSKQAKDPVVLNMQGISAVYEYFVICSGETGRQVQAIADTLKRAPGVDARRVEIDEAGNWAMVDCYDVVAHIFTENMRARYALEELWGRARKVYPVAKTKSPLKIKVGMVKIPKKKIDAVKSKIKVKTKAQKVVAAKKKNNKR